MKTIFATTNPYQGQVISSETVAKLSPKQFSKQLVISIQNWIQEGFQTVWLHIAKEQAHFIPLALNCEFSYHHFEGDTLILTKKLQTDSFIPEYPFHGTGVGGIVTHQDKVLTVVEKADISDRPGHFKFPGGMVDRGEFFEQAVKREVFEETGIQANTLGLVGFRHYHIGQFQTSNIYFLFHLEAESTNITPCPTEIAKAEWIDCSEYLKMQSVLPFNKAMLRAALSKTYLERQNIEGFMGDQHDQYEVYFTNNPIIVPISSE